MLKIFGYNFSLRYVGDLDLRTPVGACLVPLQKMSVVRGMPEAQTVSSILHEVIEAVNSQLDLNICHLGIAGLETGLYQTLTENGVDLTPLLKAIDDGPAV